MPATSHDLTPNTFQCPVSYVDEVLPTITGDEAKILIYLVRVTYSYHAYPGAFLLSEISRGTGLPLPVAAVSCTALTAARILYYVPSTNPNDPAYSLNDHQPTPELQGVSAYRAQTLRLGARDGWFCHYCGRDLLTPEDLAAGRTGRYAEVEHVIPRSRGGTGQLDNLVLACSACNQLKGTHSYEWMLATIRGQSL